MANHAIVVGVQAYTDPAVPSLTTPAGDALHMANWLLDTAGGNVLADNLHLFLSPLPAAAPDAPRVDLKRLNMLGNLKLASHDNLRGAVRDLDHGERLFFYYAGHGMQSRITFSNEDAIVPADYESGVRNALSVNSLFSHFQGKRFAEQYFFFDCCRNMLQLKEEDLDRFAPSPPSPGQPAPEQFVVYATAPGLEALDGRGMLTDVLLDGLRGRGKAKLWELSQRQYTVRVNRLFAYVTDRFDNMATAPVVGAGGAAVFLQRPWLGGQHSHDPAVVSLLEKDVQAVAFEVDLTPAGALAVAQARLMVLGDGVAINPFALQQIPFRLALPPRTYTLVLEVAPSFAAGGPWSLDVYDDPTTWPVQLQPGAPASSTPPVISTPASPPLAAAAPEGFESFGLEAPGQGGRLIVTASDQRSLLELLDVSGAAVLDPQGQPRTGYKRLDCPELDPGVYRARLRTPEGKVVETVVSLQAGQTLPVTLKAPQTVLGNLHDVLGRARSQLRSTTRSLPDEPFSFSMKGGFESIEMPGGAISVLLAAEPMPGTPLGSPDKVRTYLKEVAIRLWPFDKRPGDVRHPGLTEDQSAAVLTEAAAPGPYWLWLAAPQGPAAAFALATLDERSTQLVFRQTAAGRIHVYQFLPDRGADEAAQQQLDLAQRFLDRGQLGEALAALKGLLAAPTIDPVAGCIAGYLLGREQGATDQIERLADALVERFPRLPDAHVLRARHREEAGREDARAGYRDALDRGLPIFAHHLETLAAAVARTDLAHARRGLLEQVNQHRIPGLLWTAWAPGPDWPDAPAPTQPPEKQ